MVCPDYKTNHNLENKTQIKIYFNPKILITRPTKAYNFYFDLTLHFDPIKWIFNVQNLWSNNKLISHGNLLLTKNYDTTSSTTMFLSFITSTHATTTIFVPLKENHLMRQSHEIPSPIQTPPQLLLSIDFLWVLIGFNVGIFVQLNIRKLY